MHDRPERVRIAVQKSGRLTDHSLELLTRCGLKYSYGKDRLIYYGENMPVDVLLVRDDDIPALVREEVCELGIAGSNVIAERRLATVQAGELAAVEQIPRLDFGHCRLCIAAPHGTSYTGVSSLAGKRIATSHPNLLAEFLTAHGVDARVVMFSGAVEIAPKLGRAEYICDLVSTGATLAANNLREVEVVLECQAALIRTPMSIAAEKDEWIKRLVQRMEGVLQVRESKYIMLHAPRSALQEITRLLPGSEAPTIVPLDGCEDRVAVHAVCSENVFWETLEQLKCAGASAVLVLPVEKMLA